MGALSRQLPRRLIEHRKPCWAKIAWWRSLAYWADSNGRRNTLIEGIAVNIRRRL
jgi:hypothetical protein